MGYAGYKLCLPCITGKQLQFREWDTQTEITENKFGIKEPGENSKTLNPEIILVPILGFNAKKFRIGYGGGYYDRTFENSRALKVGVAYAVQEIKESFEEAHDIPLDMIITEKRIFK